MGMEVTHNTQDVTSNSLIVIVRHRAVSSIMIKCSTLTENTRHYTTLHYTTLHYTTLHYTQHNTTIAYNTWCGFRYLLHCCSFPSLLDLTLLSSEGRTLLHTNRSINQINKWKKRQMNEEMNVEMNEEMNEEMDEEMSEVNK